MGPKGGDVCKRLELPILRLGGYPRLGEVLSYVLLPRTKYYGYPILQHKKYDHQSQKCGQGHKKDPKIIFYCKSDPRFKNTYTRRLG